MSTMESAQMDQARGRRGYSAHLLFYSAPFLLLSRNNSTARSSAKRYEVRYEGATYGSISPTPQ